MIGMLLNVVHGQIQKAKKKHLTKESNGFHNRPFHLSNYSLAKLHPYRTHKRRWINGNTQEEG